MMIETHNEHKAETLKSVINACYEDTDSIKYQKGSWTRNDKMIELKGGFEMTNEKAYMELGNIYTRMLGTGTLCMLEYRARMNTLQEMASNDMTLKAHHRVNITSELNRLQSLAFCKYSVEE